MAKPSIRGLQLFCWLFVCIGLGLIGGGVWTLVKSLLTENWPTTEGVITSAELEHHLGDADHGDTYSAAIAYTYQVAGASYTGDKVSVGQMSASSEYARGILDRYPVGKKVTVHYSQNAPADAVLETGIHGGTWILFGVGAVFALFGIMFLQVMRAAARTQSSGLAESNPIRTNPDGSVTMDKPPILMGAIFLLAGIGICFAQPSGGTPKWVVYAAGGMFGLVGVYLLFWRCGKQNQGKLVMWLVMALFLAIFHWVSFGSGERSGTVTSPFSHRVGANVRLPFAVFTILVDAVLAAGFIRWLLKLRKK